MFDPWVGEEMETHSSIIVWREAKEHSMDRGAWQATYSPWGRKESDMTERLHFHLLSLFHIVYGCLLGVLFSYPLETYHIDEFMMFPSAAAVREKCLFTLRR